MIEKREIWTLLRQFGPNIKTTKQCNKNANDVNGPLKGHHAQVAGTAPLLIFYFNYSTETLPRFT